MQFYRLSIWLHCWESSKNAIVNAKTKSIEKSVSIFECNLFAKLSNLQYALYGLSLCVCESVTAMSKKIKCRWNHTQCMQMLCNTYLVQTFYISFGFGAHTSTIQKANRPKLMCTFFVAARCVFSMHLRVSTFRIFSSDFFFGFFLTSKLL